MKTIPVQFKTVIQKLDYLNYWFVELTPAILADLTATFQTQPFNQRLIITLDASIQWNCGVVALGEGSGFITVQKARLKILGKTIGDEVEVNLVPDTSEFGVEVAIEIDEYWNQEVESKRRFDLLTMGMKRYILNYINTAKTPEKRVERTVLLMRNLMRSTVGKESFRQLLGKESQE